jgi:hypothetical protein
MNLDGVELHIALVDYFTILLLKFPLLEASQSMDHSPNNKITDERAGGRRLSGPPVEASG